MKIKLIQTVYASDLKSRAILVMNYLIFRANQEGTCFPAIKTIARECNIGVNTVKRALDDLVDAGYVKKDARFIKAKNGAQTSNLYTLSEGMFAADDIDVTETGAAEDAAPVVCPDNDEPIPHETFEQMLEPDDIHAAQTSDFSCEDTFINRHKQCRPIPDGQAGSFSCANFKWAAPQPIKIPP